MHDTIAIYYWRSTLLKQYRDGHFIVMATSLHDARTAVRDQYEAWIDENRSWLDRDSIDDAEELAELRQKLDHDLAQNPQIIPANTSIFINGSE